MDYMWSVFFWTEDKIWTQESEWGQESFKSFLELKSLTFPPQKIFKQICIDFELSGEDFFTFYEHKPSISYWNFIYKYHLKVVIPSRACRPGIYLGYRDLRYILTSSQNVFGHITHMWSTRVDQSGSESQNWRFKAIFT